MKDERLSLFLMLGQTSQKAVSKLPDTVPAQTLMLSTTENLALVLPKEVRDRAKIRPGDKLALVSWEMDGADR